MRSFIQFPFNIHRHYLWFPFNFFCLRFFSDFSQPQRTWTSTAERSGERIENFILFWAINKSKRRWRQIVIVSKMVNDLQASSGNNILNDVMRLLILVLIFWISRRSFTRFSSSILKKLCRVATSEALHWTYVRSSLTARLNRLSILHYWVRLNWNKNKWMKFYGEINLRDWGSLYAHRMNFWFQTDGLITIKYQ